MAKSQESRKQSKTATKNGSSITKHPPQTCPPLDPVFDPMDLDRAHDALVWVLQDEEMFEGDLRFRETKLVKLMRERGVNRTLTLALLDDLVAKGVIDAEKRFHNLTIFVRFDGYQTDHAVPDCYYHTTRQRWLSYCVNRRQGRAALQPASKAPGVRNSRGKTLEARDRWIYKQCCQGTPYKEIKAQLHILCLKRKWDQLETVQGIRYAARCYAERHKKMMPPHRQNR